MKRAGLLLLVTILVATITSGCTTTYNSLSNKQDGTTELITASERDVLSAIFEAITQVFPSANVTPLQGYQQGFTWYHMPLLDRTNFRLTINKRKGIQRDGPGISGYSYNIATHGTQGLVEVRYVSPLVAKIADVLRERGIKTAFVTDVTYITEAEGDRPRGEPANVQSGTGFFVSSHGHVVTNHHVIEGTTKVSIVLFDGKAVPAKVIQSDPNNDIALIKAEVASYPLPLVQGKSVIKGSEVFTLGYPLVGIQGQEQKATFGRVNALSGIQGDIRYLQIDVPIQPGNSGGPLISEDGVVVGVVTATLNQVKTLRATGTLPQNVNYAVKADYILPLLRFANVSLDANTSSIKPGTIRNPSILERSVVHVSAQ